MNNRNSSFFRALLWATTLAVGFGTLWALLGLWVWSAMESMQQRSGGSTLAYEQLQVRSDGTLLIASIPTDGRSLATFRDLKGKTQEVADRNGNSALQPIYLAGEHGTPGFFRQEPDWAHRLERFANEQEPRVTWYFLHDGKTNGAGYFVGYEHGSNRRVGFIGLSGFRPQPLPRQDWIPVRGELVADYSHWSSLEPFWSSGRDLRHGRRDWPPHLVLLPSGKQVRLADLAAGTVTSVFDASASIEALGVPTVGSAPENRTTELPVLVRTGQRILALNRHYQVVRSFAIPNEIDRSSAVSWYEIGNGEAIAQFLRYGAVGGDVIYRVARDGAIRERFELALQTGSPSRSTRMQGYLNALAMPVPLILVFVGPLTAMAAEPFLSYPAMIAATVKSSWPSFLVVFSGALVLAILAERRGRAFGFPRGQRFAWATFVMLLGLPAYVGFLLYRPWPIRRPCPNCQKSAPRDRDACAECGEPFPEPARKGIEVFA